MPDFLGREVLGREGLGSRSARESPGAAGAREGGLSPLGDGGARCQPVPHLPYGEAAP